MENDKKKNGNCWVACFDILGFGNDVEQFPPEHVLEQYIKVLKETEWRDVSHKWFSDCFVFYTKDDSESSFRSIDVALKFFFHRMFTQCIPMTGCLDIGKFYVDEGKGIFFGRSLVNAHRWVEGQDWIGFVLSERVRKKIAEFKVKYPNGYWDEFKKHYLNYPVPCKKGIKRKLLVYKLTINPYAGGQQAKLDRCTLWNCWGDMKAKARILLKAKRKGINSIEYKNVIRKYKNTKEFLLRAYPALKEITKNGKCDSVNPWQSVSKK